MDVEGAAGLAVLLSFGTVGALAVARIVTLARRGVNVLRIDRERGPFEALSDLVFGMSLVVLVYVSVTWALEVPVRGVPASLLRGGSPVGLQCVGVVVLIAGAALYAAALRAMGESWRFTIDRERPGELVTGRVFARSRNPIYVALALLAVGCALVVGVAVIVAAALVVLGYFPLLIRREERFLESAYGVAYSSYRALVRRYWTW